MEAVASLVGKKAKVKMNGRIGRVTRLNKSGTMALLYFENLDNPFARTTWPIEDLEILD